ncbi:2-acylglycerol O-acyltransferase 3 isoform X2 [Protopterus annectens]|nr:2-acylglycerol O-acyltransferase 3 isoform X2 [Protopterus annectens]
MFTSLWIIPVVYGTWLFFDWNTPEQGGRRFDWVRRWAVWKHHRDYFPIKMVKTVDLSPERNYVFGYHPHGIICAGAFSCFSTEATDFTTYFPGIRPCLATLAGLFRLPVYRDYIMSAGMCPVSKPSLQYLLSRNGTGNAVVIVVGGAAESLNCSPGQHQVTLKNRKGFVRLALENGADLVPVYAFGENEIFQQVIFEEGTWKRSLQLKFQKYIGFAPCLFKGEGLLSNKIWGLLPYRKSITTVVGRPVSVTRITKPSEEEVNKYHILYMEALKKLFNEHKVSCGLPESHELTIV